MPQRDFEKKIKAPRKVDDDDEESSLRNPRRTRDYLEEFENEEEDFTQEMFDQEGRDPND